MTRSLSTDQQTAVASELVRLLVCVRLDFSSGVVRLHSGAGEITVSSETYTGAGDLGSISRMAEDGSLSRNTVTMTISGIPRTAFDMKDIAFSENYQSRDVRVYLVLLDETETVIDTPITAFRGLMDTCTLSLGETATIKLTAESRLADWDRPRNRRYTDQDQQAEYSGDKGLEFVSQATEHEIRWMV